MKNILAVLALILASCAAPAAASPPQALVLVYHGIGKERPYWVSPEHLESDILFLLRHGYHPVGLRDFERYALEGVALPQRSVLLTFDDGVESVYRYALPLTRRYRVPAVAFIVGSRIGKPGHLSAPELRELHASGLWSIEAHTYDMHRFVRGARGFRAELVNPPLGAKGGERARAILTDVKREGLAFRAAGLPPPTAFAFPFGQHDELSVALLRGAYPLLFDSRPAPAHPKDMPEPRIDATAAPLPSILEKYDPTLTRAGVRSRESPGRAQRLPSAQ